MKPLKSKRVSTSPNKYLKYSGMVFQLLVMLLIGIYLGKYLDQKFSFEQQYFTAFLPLILLIAYFYKIYVDLIQDHES